MTSTTNLRTAGDTHVVLSEDRSLMANPDALTHQYQSDAIIAVSLFLPQPKCRRCSRYTTRQRVHGNTKQRLPHR